MGKGRILLMDDQEAVRNATSEILSRVGYEVTAAEDGFEAARLYKLSKEAGSPYDVVMLDLAVPGSMGGVETVQKLKEIDPEVKAIIFTGHRSDPVVAEFEKHGFEAVVTRPYRLEELTAALHRVITGLGSPSTRKKKENTLSKEKMEGQTTDESQELRRLTKDIVHSLSNVLTAISDNIILAKMYLEKENATGKALEKLANAEKEFDKVKELLSQLSKL